jgi:predicted RNA-binding Zn-ribbon protein involved in translation (DUF1610 family)
MLTLDPSYPCPECGEWIRILPTTNKSDLPCPWCGVHLRLDEDAEWENGMWHNLSKLVTVRSHWDEDV